MRFEKRNGAYDTPVQKVPLCILLVVLKVRLRRTRSETKGKREWQVLEEARGLIIAHIGWQLSSSSSQALAFCRPAGLVRHVLLAHPRPQSRRSTPSTSQDSPQDSLARWMPSAARM